MAFRSQKVQKVMVQPIVSYYKLLYSLHAIINMLTWCGLVGPSVALWVFF